MQKNYRRRSEARIKTIMTYDFKGKRVYDLGCNKGYIAEAIANVGASVIGYDSDDDAIVEARKLINDRRFLVFFWADLTPEFIAGLEKSDCVIFLAVLQHMIADMGCYAQQETGMFRAVKILELIRKNTKSMWFEMALDDEVKREGSQGLPDMGSEKEWWIMQNLLLPAGWTQIQTYHAPELQVNRFQKFLNTHFRKYLVKAPQLVRDILKYDDRDARPLFYCE